MSEYIIELNDLKKCYGNRQNVLNGINMQIAPGELCVITGLSGCGKSTLLNILGLLDIYNSGEYWLDGKLITSQESKNFPYIRNQKIGFVFQQYHLIPNLTVKQNLFIPFLYKKQNRIDMKQFNNKLDETLDLLNLSALINEKVDYLSGGEKQRVGICRVLLAESEIILADEPTGNLDSLNREKIVSLFQEINKTLSRTILIVTHDEQIANISDRRFRMEAGILYEK